MRNACVPSLRLSAKLTTPDREKTTIMRAPGPPRIVPRYDYNAHPRTPRIVPRYNYNALPRTP
eukprot:3740606-Ditylum_brightwellii.AAC.1